MKIMGILNLTPDSFYDGGSYGVPDKALFRAEEMLREGAAVLDLGAESTRPGFTPVPASEEMERLLPVLEALGKRFPIPISVDTRKAAVAREALKAGASMINDVSGFMEDGAEMAETAALFGADFVVTHSANIRDAADPPKKMLEDLEASMKLASSAGIPTEKLILDPGIGFGKTQAQNMYLLNHLNLLDHFPCRKLLGASRKSVIGNHLELPPGERLEGTLATTAMAFFAGYDLVRVHDVRENYRLIRMLEGIAEAQNCG